MPSAPGIAVADGACMGSSRSHLVLRSRQGNDDRLELCAAEWNAPKLTSAVRRGELDRGVAGDDLEELANLARDEVGDLLGALELRTAIRGLRGIDAMAPPTSAGPVASLQNRVRQLRYGDRLPKADRIKHRGHVERDGFDECCAVAIGRSRYKVIAH